MKSNTIILTFLIASILLAMIGTVSASSAVTTLRTPASSATITGASTLNVTIANPDGNYSCKFYAKSASTANSSWGLVKLETNASSEYSAISLNTTFSSLVLQDSNDYIFNATCFNDTTIWPTVATATGITIDNTDPSAATARTPATNSLVTSAGTQTFSGTVIDSNTTGCTLKLGINGGNLQTYTMTYSTSTCSYDYTGFSDSSINENYQWYIISSDGTDTATSDSNVIQVQITPTAGGVANQAQLNAVTQQQQKALSIGDTLGENQTTVFIIALILIIIAIIYFTRK